MSVDDKQIGGTHYKDLAFQPWDVVKAWEPHTFTGFQVHLWASAVQYLARPGRKGSATEDIQKAIHYLEKLEEELRAPRAETTAPTPGVPYAHISGG